MADFKWGDFSPKALDSIHNSDARINIWHGAVRSGKTINSIVAWLNFIRTAPQGANLLMAGVTRDSLKANILDEIESIVGPANFSHNRGMGEAVICGRKVILKGAGDEGQEKKIRGLTLYGAYGDEITMWTESFFSQILRRLSLPGARSYFTTNPDSPFHWLKKRYLDRKDEPGMDLKDWHFSLDDNPNLDQAYKDALAAEHTGLWYQRFYLGLWRQAAGAIYDMFSIEEAPQGHIVPFLPRTFDKIAVGVDYGTSSVTTFLALGRNNGKWYVFREYYWDAREKMRQKTNDEFADDFVEFIEGSGYPDLLGKLKPASIEVDPSAAGLKLDLRKRGFSGLVRNADNDVIEGIRNVGDAFAAGDLRIYEKCENTIQEHANYVWDEDKQNEGIDEPVKENDHTCFVAGTQIRTQRGDVPIEEVRVGDKALTGMGYQRVYAAGLTYPDADVFRVRASDGRTLTATHNHPVWVQGRGFVSLDALRYGDILWTCGQSMLSPGEELPSDDTQTPINPSLGTTTSLVVGTEQKGLVASTKRFIRYIMARFQRGITSITSTAIPSIMRPRTLNASQAKITPPCTALSGSVTLKNSNGWSATSQASGPLPLSGTPQKRGDGGIAKTRRSFGQNESPFARFASIAIKNSTTYPVDRLLGSAQKLATPPPDVPAGWTMKKEPVRTAMPASPSISTVKAERAPQYALQVLDICPAGTAPVYNLSVENAHEYFANGILVHNCDTVRYVMKRHYGRPALRLVEKPTGT